MEEDNIKNVSGEWLLVETDNADTDTELHVNHERSLSNSETNNNNFDNTIKSDSHSFDMVESDTSMNSEVETFDSDITNTTVTRHSWHADETVKGDNVANSNSIIDISSRDVTLTADDVELSSILAHNTPLQMRAVSSPALTEGPLDEPIVTSAQQQQLQQKRHSNSNSSSNRKELDAKQQQIHSATSASVLQKFKKTFSHFHKSSGSSSSGNSSIKTSVWIPSVITDNGNGEDLLETKHRFGPLVWRTSKERKKTKIHRRDKCNSGDSGIQVELDNDELTVTTTNYVPDNMETSSPSPRVVRSGSTKSSNASPVPSRAPIKVRTSNKEEEIATTTTLSMRSLSQPTGLDRISSSRNNHHHHHHNNNRTDDEVCSDTDSISSTTNETDSVTPVRTNNKSSEKEIDPEVVGEQPCYAEVLYNFKPGGPEELPLQKGDLVEVIKKDTGPWWWGQIKLDAVIAASVEGQAPYGWFPKDFVRILPNFVKPRTPRKQSQHISRKHHHHHHHRRSKSQDPQAIHHMTESEDDDSESELHVPNLVNIVQNNGDDAKCTSQQTNEIMRQNAIKELINAESVYVNLLESLCTGFIKTMREHTEIFTIESINTIFSNIEKLWSFQQTFLQSLKQSVPNNRIGEVFLEYQSAFMVYSTYCNSYPRALMELETYTGNKEALQLLENCRLSTNLPELPLSAHLLAPIQRICRYPLHLSELVKYTPNRREIILSMDYRNMTKSEIETIDCREIFEVALNAMKKVTEMVNEGKRHSEYLSRIQARFENFQGPSINVHSTRLFLQTDAIRMTPNLWNNTYTLFLFDRQLIYCKKDLLKRTNYIYKGRIFLDNCRILNLPDGKMFGVTLKNALRVYCDSRNKWFDFCFRSNSSKLRFLNTLSAERQFCGESLFVSELAGMDEDNFSDREYISDNNDDNNSDMLQHLNHHHHHHRNERPIDVETTSESNSTNNDSSPSKPNSLNSDTLPKKSRKLSKENVPNNYHQEFNSNSLGRGRRLGNWFRKSKSTNSTPSHSPTHATGPIQPTMLLNSESSSSQSNSSLNLKQSNSLPLGQITTNGKVKNGGGKDILTPSPLLS
uniref:CSON008918 protein n=1 Tax=Culicoides sonorensis TaxID=179676 RepID=A0A336KDU4_CULSO